MLVLGLVLSLAACGASSRTDGLSKAEEAALEARLAEAEAATLKAEAAIAQAELDKAKLEADKARAEAEVQHQLRAAEAARRAAEVAEAARLVAEAARLAAEAAAETARQETETAEQARERLAAEAEEARQQVLQAEAIDALTGLGRPELSAPEVMAQDRAPALVTSPNAVTPPFTFASPSGSSAGDWYVTRAHSRGQAADDTVVVYSDVGPPVSTPIRQAPLHTDRAFTVLDNDFLEIEVAADDSALVASSSSLFPRKGTTDNIRLTVDTSDPPDLADNVMYEQTAQIPGTFDGASGHYQCVGSGATACSVRHTNVGPTKGYVLGAGTWTFKFASKSPTVNVADAESMSFGWWRRKVLDGENTGDFQYAMFRMSTGPELVTGFPALQGSATYEGPAIGQYAVPLGTQLSHGEFNATARFTANFGNGTEAGTLSGSVSGFDVSPGWSLTLQEANMTNTGTVAAGNVSWTIDGNTQGSGEWDGFLHSEIAVYAGHVPDGLTGTFNAQYNSVATLRGAYGGHKQ